MRYAPVILLLLALACTPTPAHIKTNVVKIYIAERGMYRVTRADLQHVGFSVTRDEIARIHLTHKGTEIPIAIESPGNDFAITFYAVPDKTIYSRTDVYWLTLSETPGARINTRAVAPAGENFATSFFATLHLEQDRIYAPEPVDDQHWFWQKLTAPTTQTVTATVIAPYAGDAQIEIALAGATTGKHRIQIAVNQQTAGVTQWQGRTRQIFKANISNLRAGENVITLATSDTADQVEIDYLDALTLTYPRAFVAENDLLEFRSSAQNFQIREFDTDNSYVYDVTNPHAVQKLDGVRATRVGNTTALTFRDELAEREYLAMSPRALKAPKEIRAAYPNDLRETNQQAAYLIIAPAIFSDALQPLLQYHHTQGLTTRLVDIEQVFDAFSDGVPDPRALRDFLNYTRERWCKPAPRFVLLVGKATYDYRDNLAAPNPNLLPTYLVPTPHLGEAANDDWFVTTSADDSHPALALGRIPAKTAAQVTIAVKKILTYEDDTHTADWQRRAIFIADNKEPGFTTRANEYAQTLPPIMHAGKIFLATPRGDSSATRAEILRQWNAGASLLTYIGHGSIDTWAERPLFSSENIGVLQNANRLPILLTPTCLDGFFYHPEKDSLAEQLLFKSDGGIIAALAPTGLSLPHAQDILMHALFAELFQQSTPTLGEAILHAKQKLDANSPDTREVLETFALLGDPALKWRVPQ